MIVRPRHAADLPACAAALRRVHDADAYPLNWPDDPQAWLTPATAAWVAEDGELIVGHVAVLDDEVTRLFVVPEARRHGTAGALLAEARTWAAAHQRVLTLNVVATDRSSAIAFYESTGWRYTRTTVAGWSAPDGGPVELRHYVDVRGVAGSPGGTRGERRDWPDGPDPR
ncbi:GNAT family N-acetyltransferase [Paractinoplanes lichenicola]|uniref:GNAT family N-acetyltransferase n=1 Tax=Paractinoplanes lichenicola TaxID=2802976 RepID=A0ABS1VLP9_9ACTN|nr:GNAT family N-acetyltransferase [Actinoplanes lichenicola]MBL7254416.1 GNAT family N-acetyltransferase [Actinoplanes lichenicola]